MPQGTMGMGGKRERDEDDQGEEYYDEDDDLDNLDLDDLDLDQIEMLVDQAPEVWLGLRVDL